MKTKNNIQKTALKSVAAATGLAILSLTVHAQVVFKSFFENDGTGHIAMIMENTTNNSFASNSYSGNFTSAETFAAYLEAETEEPLNVEAWMVEEANFEMLAEIETETEIPMETEAWMTSTNTFDGFTAYLETETESELVIENWMLNENSFEAILKIETETENPLQVENWMTDDSDLNSLSASLKTESESELALENWMINDKIFNNIEKVTEITKVESQPISTATYFYREVNIEEKLEVENWMLNSKVCGK